MKVGHEDIEWLNDYCGTLRAIANDPEAPYVERQEARMKLRATLEQIREMEKNGR